MGKNKVDWISLDAIWSDSRYDFMEVKFLDRDFNLKEQMDLKYNWYPLRLRS